MITDEEYEKCRVNPKYFIEKYLIFPRTPRPRISLFQYQNDAIDNFQKHRFNIILKARQVGVSSVVNGYVIWLKIFNRDCEIGVCSPNENYAVAEIEDTARRLPDRFAISFAGRKKINKIKANRGYHGHLDLLVMEEASWIVKPEMIWASNHPSLGRNGSCIITSSARFTSDWFYDMWDTSFNIESGLNPMRISSDACPTNEDIAWQKLCMAEKEFRASYYCEFFKEY